jgi:hypothetical protein
MRILHRSFALAAALATCSCGEAGVFYDVKYSPGFSSGPVTVSVLGVYQDGRMSNELRDEVDARLAPVLGQPTCEVGWGDKLRTAEPDFFEEMDRATQADGITEETLDRFSGWAEGDAILVVSLNVRRGSTQPMPQTGTGTMNSGLGGSNFNRGTGPLPGSRGRGGAPPTPGAIRPGTWQGQQIRIAGIFFSAKTHGPMGRIVLNYLGTNIDDALRRFVRKINEELPGSVCKGWKIEPPKATGM